MAGKSRTLAACRRWPGPGGGGVVGVQRLFQCHVPVPAPGPDGRKAVYPVPGHLERASRHRRADQGQALLHQAFGCAQSLSRHLFRARPRTLGTIRRCLRRQAEVGTAEPRALHRRRGQRRRRRPARGAAQHRRRPRLFRPRRHQQHRRPGGDPLFHPRTGDLPGIRPDQGRLYPGQSRKEGGWGDEPAAHRRRGDEAALYPIA